MGWDAFLAADQAAPQFIFWDSCLTEEAPHDLPENVLLATQNGACAAPLHEVLADWLQVPGLQTDQWGASDQFQVVSTLTQPFVFRGVSSDVRLSADDYTMLDSLSEAARDRMIALWREAGIAVDYGTAAPVPISAPVRAIAPVNIVQPVVAPAQTNVVRVIRNVTLVPPAGDTRPAPIQIGAQPGLPQPSILIGFAVDTVPSAAPLVPVDPIAGAGFEVEDRGARDSLRASDADAFSDLIAAGAFDPQDGDLARALQAELAVLNCYTIRVDGDWGPGSERALRAFYAELGVPVQGADANLDVYRQVIGQGDVRCSDPTPVAVPQPAAQAQQVATTAPSAPAPVVRRSAAVAPTPVASPAPAAAAQQPARRTINQTGGTGVFR